MNEPVVTLLVGDVLQRLAQLPDESVHCVVTSPPYWGLRDYGVPGQLGLEPTLGEHIETMVGIFREVRRVLRKDGTCWVNYGDCYATSPNGKSAAAYKADGSDDRTFRDKPFSTIGPIYSHGPGTDGAFPRGTGARRGGGNNAAGPVYCPDYEKTARVGKSENGGHVAAAHGGRILAGGYLKPKDLVMVPNRFAIAMQDDGWWVRSEIIWHKPNPMPESSGDRPHTAHEKIWLFTKSERYWYDAESVRTAMKESSVSRLNQNLEMQAGSLRANGGRKTNGPMKAVGRAVTPRHEGQINHTGITETPRGSANLKNVWTIATRPFKAAHFATFPPELPEICIKAGCPVGGTVLDPFGGAGTTGLIAARLLRNAIMIELNQDYAAIAVNRLRGKLVRVVLDGMDEPAPEPLFEVAAE